MARKKSGGEGGGNAVLVIFLVVFALAAIALGVMYWTGQEKVAAADAKGKQAEGDIAAANKLKEEAEAKVLLYKTILGVATKQEETDLTTASNGSKTETLWQEHSKLIDDLARAQKTAVDDFSKTADGVALEKLGFKPDPKAQPVTWTWVKGGALGAPAPGTMIERMTRVTADRERAFRVAEIERKSAMKSGQDYVKAKGDYDKNLVESKAQVAEQIKKLDDAMAKVDGEMKEEIKKYKDDTEAIRGDIKKKMADRQDLADQLTVTKAILTKVEDRLRNEEARRNAEELEKNGAFAINLPHGSITKRNFNEKMVEIDIGSAAGLKAGQTFTVQPSSTRKEGLGKQSKGQIEVVKVNGPNESTARITGEVDDIRDSILKGDLLYNPLFHKNAKDHVVLVGIFDTDGDGVDDIEKVAADLSKRGAIVDGYYDLSTNKWVSPDRSVTKPGPNANTTYVIRGWEFDSSSTPQLAKEFGELRTTINQTVAGVRQGGAQEVRAIRFLTEIGYTLSLNINDQSITTAAIRYTGKASSIPAPVPAPK